MTTTDEENRRFQFILHMYDQYWDNITRAESSSWETMGAVTGLFGFFAYVGGKLTTMEGFLWTNALTLFTIVLILTFGITSSLRHILLYARNLTLVSRIEQVFLDPEKDYGSLVPRSFKKAGEKLIRYTEIWSIQLFYYIALLVVVVVVGFFSDGIVLSLFLAGASFTPSCGIYYTIWRRHKEDYKPLSKKPLPDR